MVSSPVININGAEAWGNEESLHGDCGVGAEKAVGGDGVGSHACMSPVHLDRDDVGVVKEVGSDPVQMDNSGTRPKVVGPEEVCNFRCGSGESKKKPSRRRRSGLVSKKAQSSSFHGKEDLSGDARPKKRPRESASEELPGFGFVGFTDRLQSEGLGTEGEESEGPVDVGEEVRIDLNVRATAEGSFSGNSMGSAGQEPEDGEDWSRLGESL
ncbi:hypothetical protein Hanom_Chr06g00493921 [Helianthus anomalus]